jgi:hypothetical protein
MAVVGCSRAYKPALHSVYQPIKNYRTLVRVMLSFLYKKFSLSQRNQSILTDVSSRVAVYAHHQSLPTPRFLSVTASKTHTMYSTGQSTFLGLGTARAKSTPSRYSFIFHWCLMIQLLQYKLTNVHSSLQFQ